MLVTCTEKCVFNTARVNRSCFSVNLHCNHVVQHNMSCSCSTLAWTAGKKIHSNQYSLTEYYSPVHKGEVQLPAIYFLYDLSPIVVAIKDARASFAHLLVRLCAVIGGVFAITGGLSAFHSRSMQPLLARPAFVLLHVCV